MMPGERQGGEGREEGLDASLTGEVGALSEGIFLYYFFPFFSFFLFHLLLLTSLSLQRKFLPWAQRQGSLMKKGRGETEGGRGEGKGDTRRDADVTDRRNSMRWPSFIS